MRIKLLLIFLFSSSVAFSQRAYLDSLWRVWSDKQQPDTTRLNALYDFAWDGYLFNQPDSAYYFSGFMLEFAKDTKQKKYEAKANNLQGTYFFNTGDYKNAMISNVRSMEIMKEIGDQRGVSASLSNIGVIYKVQGDLTSAIDCYIRSLKIKEELGDQKGIGISYNNIGNLYSNLGNYKKALHYFTEGLRIWEKLEDKKGISGILNNIGMIHYGNKDFNQALICFERSLELRQEVDDQPGVAKSLASIGMLYANQKDYVNANEYYEKSLKITEEVDDKQGVANVCVNLGTICVLQGQYSKATVYLNRALKIARNIGAVLEIQSASEQLYKTYKQTGRAKEALEMHELSTRMRDSLFSEQSKNELVKQEFKYQYEKKVAADSVLAIEEKKVVAAQFSQERSQRNILYAGMGLVLVFGGFMFSRFRVTRKQKTIIEFQKQVVEEKQRAVLDSIRYAKRIQQSLLPTEKYINRNMDRLRNKK